MAATLEKWQIVLEVTIDRNVASAPDIWKWRELLDLGPDESVKVVSTEKVEDNKDV